MTNRSISDQLDDVVTAFLADGRPDLTNVDPLVIELAGLAEVLHGLPSEDFYNELKRQLERSNEMSSPALKIDSNAVRKFSTYICVSNASAAIDFYIKAFGAKELMRLTEPSGKIGHAELQIGDSILAISDEYPDYGTVSPHTLGGSPIRLHLYVEDVDEFARRAVAFGASISRPIEDQFYGDRAGQLADPFGYTWIVASHIKDVSVEEMQEQLNLWAKQNESKKKREGFHTVTPYLTVKEAPELVDFVKNAFGATEI